MGAGLLAGLGKGIAAAGDVFGRTMIQEEMAKRAEARSLALQEAKEARAEARADAKAKANMQAVTDAYARAEEMPMERRASGMLAAAEGLPQEAITRPDGTRYERWADGKTADEIKQRALEEVRSLTPEARKIYEDAGILTKEGDPRLQRERDAAEAAAQAGASSEVLKYFEASKKAVLDEIKAENTVKVAELREDRRDARQAETLALQTRQLELSERNSERRHQQTMARMPGGKNDDKLSETQKARLDILKRNVLDAEKALGEAGSIKSRREAAQARLDEAYRKLDEFTSQVDGKPSEPKPSTPKPPATENKPTAAPPVRLLQEGKQTTFANGQVWTLKNGKPVQVK